MWAAWRGLAVRPRCALPVLRLHNGRRPVAAHFLSGARALAVPAGWDKEPADVFPTTADVAMFVSSERYRWEAVPEAGSAEGDDAAAAQLSAAKRMMLRHAAVELGVEDGPGAAEIQRYLQVGTWREAELYDSLRPGAEHLEMMSKMLGLEPSAIKHVVDQLRHTSANPLGAAMKFPTEADGGPSLDTLLEELKGLSYNAFALRYPGKGPEYIKSVWDLVQGKDTSELSAAEIQSLQTVGQVLDFLEALGVAFPSEFGANQKKTFATEELTQILEQRAAEMEGEAGEVITALKAAIEADGRDAWKIDDLVAAIGDGGSDSAALEAATAEEGSDADEEEDGDDDDDEDAEDEDAEAAEALMMGAKWDIATGGLASNVGGSFVLGDGDFATVDREEYADRLQHYLGAGIRGHVFLALDSMGISVESFREWLKTGEIPLEWGGATLDHAELQLMQQHAAQNALLIKKLGRLVTALRRAPKAMEQAAIAPSWRSALAKPPTDARVEAPTGMLAALGWAADSLEVLAGTDAGDVPSAPGLQAALDRVSEAVKSSAGYEIAGNDAQWPYRAGDEGSESADLTDILKVVSQVCDELGPSASSIGALCADITKGCESFEHTTDKLVQQTEVTSASQAALGGVLSAVSGAAGLTLEEFSERYREQYFQKIAAGELSTFEESHEWFCGVRAIYWAAAGQQWTLATLRPHIYRAMVEELSLAAANDYWRSFIAAKEEDLKSGAGKRGGGNRKKAVGGMQVDPSAM